MAGYTEKKEIKKALAEAKRLAKEPEPVPTREKEAELYKEMMALSEKLKEMLKPAWFVKDVHKKAKENTAKKKKKAKKKSKKKKASKKKKK